MTPDNAAAYGRNIGLSDSELVGDQLLRDVIGKKFPNLGNICSRKHGSSRSFPYGLPSFGDAVLDVLGLCAKEHVLRVDAMPYIARMANVQPRWYGTAREFPCDSVSPSAIVVNHELAVSGRYTVAGPQPAPISFTNVSPESFTYRHRLWRHAYIVTQDACV